MTFLPQPSLGNHICHGILFCLGVVYSNSEEKETKGKKVNVKRLKNKELQIIKISRQNKNKTKTKPDASKLLLNILV